MKNIKGIKLVIFLFLFGISVGVIGGKVFYFFNPETTVIMVVEMDDCVINYAELKVHNQIIRVDANSMSDTLDIQFFSNFGNSYQYELILHTENCGDISTGIRKITDGHIFYERMYKGRIEHEIRA